MFMKIRLAKFLIFALLIFPLQSEAARIWSSGVELNTITSGVEFFRSAGTMETTTTIVRSGTYSLVAQNLVSGTEEMKGTQVQLGTANLLGPFWSRVYVNFITLPTVENRFVVFENNSNSDIVYATVGSSTDNFIRLYDEDGLIGTSTAINTSTWYRVELQLDARGAGSTDQVSARLDGTEFASSSIRNLSSGIHKFSVGANISNQSQNQGLWYFDDLAFNESTTTISNHNNFPGEGKIIHLRPNADGDNEMGTSTPGTANSFTVVDEITPDDVTSYWALVTDDDILDVNIDPAASGSISTEDTVILVQVGTRQAMASNAAGSWKTRIKSQSAGAISSSTVLTQNDSIWRTNNDTIADVSDGRYYLTSYVDPQTNEAWTSALLDTAQIGVISTDADPDNRFSTLWALVEYVDNPVISGVSAAPIIEDEWWWFSDA